MEINHREETMPGKLEVSFNSPQCGWMSIGFKDGANEFNTTTAHAPHSNALSELLTAIISMLKNEDYEYTLKWNRDPEEFDFDFRRSGDKTSIEITEYPTGQRDQQEKEKVFGYIGDARQIAEAFYETFRQLYEERDVDEFEDNWQQKFPFAEFERLREAVGK